MHIQKATVSKVNYTDPLFVNIIIGQANSNNVIRAGLTPKFKDKETLLNVKLSENFIINDIISHSHMR